MTYVTSIEQLPNAERSIGSKESIPVSDTKPGSQGLLNRPQTSISPHRDDQDMIRKVLPNPPLRSYPMELSLKYPVTF